jgi:membrane protease YdiL (CAAX protease family)
LPGLIAVSVLFASLHFLANVKIAHQDVTPWSGLLLLTSTFADFMHPDRLADAFLALVGVGLLTGLARLKTGNVLFAAGLHGGWVMVMRTTIGITQLPLDAPNAWLLSNHDGYTGWLVTFFILVFLAAAKLASRPLLTLLGVR